MEDEKRQDIDRELVTIRFRRSHLNLFAAALVGFLAGFWLSEITDSDVVVPDASRINFGTPAPSSPPVRVEVATEGRPAKGPEDAPVVIVEFTDYQCPFCKRYADEVLGPLLEEYDDEIRYVIRNFPLPEVHPFAHKAAEAAECAFEQGDDEFWKMHDLLFANQSALSADDLKGYARDVGLSGGDFDSCLTKGEKEDVVAKDIAEARSIGATGTPTFVINGVVYKGAANLDAFKSRVELALESA